MKQVKLTSVLLLCCLATLAQINQGGYHAGFGIDADTRAGYKKYGPALSHPQQGDDWFRTHNIPGKSVIDTVNAAFWKSQLQTRNISFVQKMSMPAFSNVNGKLWLDAVYIRDYTRNPGKDSTAFTGSDARNGVNPNSWDGAVKDVDEDVDIVDAYAHFRRNGDSAKDSLWFFTAVSTVGTSNGRYVDVELFNKQISYNRITRKFSTQGLSGGHTEWIFDATGKVIQTGDVLITLVYQNGQKPKMDLHIWVSKLTMYTVNPSLFNFGGTIHSASSWSGHGYAHIIPNSSSHRIGAALSNVGGGTTQDTTWSTPWGTLRSNGTWNQSYQSKQLVELAINFTKIGLDPSSYLLTANQACNRLYTSILFKSGTYEDGDGDDDGYRGVAQKGGGHGGGGNDNDCGDNNEDVTMDDFAGPINFETPVMSFSVKNDTLTCDKPVVELEVENAPAGRKYEWYTLNGEIMNCSNDSSKAQVKKSGIYTVSGRLAAGCPVTQVETVTVLSDSSAPDVVADITLTNDGNIQLLGMSPSSLTNIISPFGASQGLTWQWEGPSGFTSNEQNPVLPGEWIWGSYYLTVKELRNGCTARTSLDISFRGNNEVRTTTSSGNTKMLQPTRIVQDQMSSKLYLQMNAKQASAATVCIYSINGQLLQKTGIRLQEGNNRIELPVPSAKGSRLVTISIGNKLIMTKKISL